MNHSPILFSTPMVRALLEGRKTMTRRIIKSQPPEWAAYPQPAGDGWEWTDRNVDADDLQHWPDYYKPMLCPYGKPGDLLWVRETWHTDEADLIYARAKHEDLMSASPIFYRADPVNNDAGCVWRPSIFMPKWASRITLKITDVRAELLRAITEEDAKSEGAEPVRGQHKFGFLNLWISINGPTGWIDNPWVWVISFEVINQNVLTYMNTNNQQPAC